MRRKRKRRRPVEAARIVPVVIVAGMPEFVEVADRVWVARYEWADVNITAIGGDRELVVVDTHGSAAAGRTVIDDISRLAVGPVIHVVNSHWHWDHSFGNVAFREASKQCRSMRTRRPQSG